MNMQTHKASRAPRIARMLALALASTPLAVPAAWAQAGAAESATGIEAVKGALADGTPFLVRKPANWNGIVVIDLDGIERGYDGSYQLMLKAGYGTAGVSRRRNDRLWTLNRSDDVRRPQEALAVFKEKFGKPRFVIVFGGSAGGGVGLLTAERHPETVDGAVAMCAIMPFANAHYNLIFDFFYTLKVLLAPTDDKLVTHALPAHDYRPVMKHWLDVIQAAAKTPEGRARIALAYAIGQYPVYGSKSTTFGLQKPDQDDPNAVMAAMVKLVPDIVARLRLLRSYGEKDFPADLAIRGTPVSNLVGNDGAVYADYWKNADPQQKRLAETIYAQAGLNLDSDLKSLDAAPRVKLDRSALRGQGLFGHGLPTMPVFRMDNLGDLTAPPNASKLYDSLVAANGLGDRVRTSYVDNSGHCFFKPEHEFMAVEVMRERLETGKWPDTSPAALNARIGYTDRWVMDGGVPSGGEVIDTRGMSFVERNYGPYLGMWRLWEYPEVYAPTFATTTALVKGKELNLTPLQRNRLLAQIKAAERADRAGRTAERDAALDGFAGVAKGVADRIALTRLLAIAHRLRGQTRPS